MRFFSILMLVALALACNRAQPKANAPATDVRAPEVGVPLAEKRPSIGEPKLLETFEDARAGALAFQPDSFRLIAAYGNTVTVYEGDAKRLWEGASFRKHLVVGGDGTLYLDHLAWLPEKSSAPANLADGRKGYELRGARYTTNGEFLAVSVGWRPPRGMPTRGPDGEKSYRYARPNKPDGPREFFRVVKASDGAETLRADGRHFGLASSADHFAVAMARVNDVTEVVLIEAESGKRRALDRESKEPVRAGLLSFSADGQTLVSVTYEGILTRWSAPDFHRTASATLQLGEAAVKSIAVHPGGAIFVGLSDGQMMFVDPEDGRVLQQWSVATHAKLDDFQREISAAAISGDGTRLGTVHAAVGSGLRIWDLPEGK
jgi:WD40 repeat protein